MCTIKYIISTIYILFSKYTLLIIIHRSNDNQLFVIYMIQINHDLVLASFNIIWF